jgi:hypothetical protein
MAGCTRGICTITASPCCCGTPLCRLAMERRFQSTVGGSTWSTTCRTVRSTLTSGPTPCFLMGVHGPRGFLGMTWMMPWRRLLTRRSPPCAHSACRTLWARLSHYTRSRTTLIRSGRHTLMRRAASSRTITTLVGRTWRDMPSTCSSCSTTPSALLLDNVVVSILMQGGQIP